MSVRKGSVVIASFVDDSNVVHKTSTETITGAKTVNNEFSVVTSGVENHYINQVNSGIVKGIAPSSIGYWALCFNDSTNTGITSYSSTRLGCIKGVLNTDNVMTVSIDAHKNAANSTEKATISVSYDTTNNTAYCNLPTNTYGTNFHGTADYAKYADLAEKYQSDQEYSVGTLIKFGGEKDITIADNKVNGVISYKPGVVLDSELEDGQSIALVGKTPIRIIGKVNKFDNITLSEIPGIGRVAKEGEVVIAKALEVSENEEEKLVLCVTKFNLD